MRSFLFVPGDSERKQAKALASGADAIILDLEDSVAEDTKKLARQMVGDFLKTKVTDAQGPKVYVRVNSIETPHVDLDIQAVVPGRPAGILLPKAKSLNDVQFLDHKLADAERAASLEQRSLRLVVMVTETPQSILNMGQYMSVPARTGGFAWGGEDLAAALGARDNHDEEGAYSEPYRLARTLCLMAASAAGVQPIDAVYTDFRDGEGLRREALEGARDGFTGKLAIHPDQVAIINDAFTPSDADVEEAKAVVAAFEADQGIGVVGLKDKMLDLPNLIIARNTLHRAKLAGKL